MENKKVLVVDTDALNLKEIQELLFKQGYKVIGMSDAKEVMEQTEKISPDVVLLNPAIVEKQLENNELDDITKKCKAPVVYMTTKADEEFIERVKVAEPYGCIAGPYNENMLKATIETALIRHKKDSELRQERDYYYSISEKHNADDSIFIRSDFRLVRIKFSDIFYIEALKDYIIIFTGDNVYTTHCTMKAIFSLLPMDNFLRVHRSFIVNKEKIASIKYPELVIDGKMKVIPIGGLYRKELYKRLKFA